MTDKLADYGAGAFISKFVAAGPKNYSYKVQVPGLEKKERVVKIRGIPLTSYTTKKVNMKVMRETVFEYMKGKEKQVALYYPKIVKTADRRVATKLERKIYRMVYDKRVIKPDFTTIPYGY